MRLPGFRRISQPAQRVEPTARELAADRDRSWSLGRKIFLAGLLLAFPAILEAQTLGQVEHRLDVLESTVKILAAKQNAHVPAQVPEPIRPADGMGLIELNNRIAAVERFMAQLLADQQHDRNSLAQLAARQEQTRSEAGQPHQSDPGADPAPQLSYAETRSPLPSADERYGRARRYFDEADWTRADIALGDFVRDYPSDTRVGEAQFLLARSKQELGVHAEAAKIFLDLYEKYPSAVYAADNLISLARSLEQLGPDSAREACGVIAEVESSYKEKLDEARRAAVLELKLKLACT